MAQHLGESDAVGTSPGPSSLPQAPYLVWPDIVVGALGLVALIGAVVLLTGGRDVPPFLAAIPSTVLGYYAGTVRRTT